MMNEYHYYYMIFKYQRTKEKHTRTQYYNNMLHTLLLCDDKQSAARTNRSELPKGKLCIRDRDLYPNEEI